MAERRFISYLRVATAKQSRSGFGLDAQRETVRTFLNGGAWELADEFVEGEGGRVSDRPQLAAALARCRVIGATLIVANVSRLTRNPDFMHRLVEAGVDVRFCELPKIDGPSGKLMLRQMLAIAELEAGLISERTKKALAAAKARGVKLGNPGNLSNRLEGHVTGLKVRREKALRRATDLQPIIADLQAHGAASLRDIARGLNERGIRTAKGGEWSAVQVQRVLAKM